MITKSKTSQIKSSEKDDIKLEEDQKNKFSTDILEADQAQCLFAELIQERRARFQWMLKAKEINRELTYWKTEANLLSAEVQALTLEAINLKSRDISDTLKISKEDVLTNEHPEYGTKWVIVKSKD